MEFLIPVLFLLVIGLVGWVVYDIVSRFGWQAFFVKFALYANFFFVCSFITVPQLLWTKLRSGGEPSVSVGSMAFLVILICVVVPLLASDRATPWLLKPAVKWSLLGCFALFWIAMTGGAFLIVAAFLVGKVGF